MGQDPREVFRKLQQTLGSAQRRAGGGLPGGPRNFFGGAAGLVLLGTGVVVFNNALFNGIPILATQCRKPVADSSQWTVVIEPSSTQG
jgi:hypothetical protein